MIIFFDKELNVLKSEPNSVHRNSALANVITVCAPFVPTADFEISFQNPTGYIETLKPMTATGEITGVQDVDGNEFAIWTFALNSLKTAYTGQLKFQIYAIASGVRYSSPLLITNVLAGVPMLLPENPDKTDYAEIIAALQTVIDNSYDTETIPATGWRWAFNSTNKTCQIIGYTGANVSERVKIPLYHLRDDELYTVTGFFLEEGTDLTKFSAMRVLDLPETLTYFGVGSGVNTFGASANLTELTLPESLTNLNGQCLPYSLKTITFKGSNPAPFDAPVNNQLGDVNCLILCPQKYLSSYAASATNYTAADNENKFIIRVSYLNEQTIFIPEATTLDTNARIALHKPIKDSSQTYYYIGETADDYIYACSVHQINATDFIYFNKETLTRVYKRIYAVDRLSLSISTTISDYINEYGNVVQSVSFYYGGGVIKGNYFVCAYKENNKYYAQITSCIDNRRWYLDGATDGNITFNAIMTATYQDDYALQSDLTIGLADKVDKSAIKQTTGDSTTDIMSQKAITDALLLKLPTSTKYGASLSVTFNSADGTLTAQLIDQNGNNLGTAQTVTIDLQSLENAIDAIENLIPAQASAENQLADKNFVNSTVATNTANFCGTYNLVTDLGLTSSATETQIATVLAVKLSSLEITVTNNDYAYVAYPNASEPTQFDRYDRYKYSSASSEWGYEFTLNNSSFTSAQWAAINSLITAAKVTAYDTHIADKNNPHEVTKSQVGLGNVDNTSDLDKPISTATQTALNGKQDLIDSTHKLSADLIEDGTTNKIFTATEQSKLSGIETGAEVNDVDSVNGQTGTVVLDADDISDTNTTNKFVTASEKETWNAKQDAVPTITLTQSMITGYGGYDYPNTTNSNDWIRFNIGQANQYLVSDNYDTIKLDIRQIKAFLNLPTDYVWIKRNATNSQDNNGTTITLYQFFASYDGFEYEGLLDPTNPYVAILQNGSAGFIYNADYGLAWLTFRNFNITDIYSRISVLETGKQDKLTFDSTPTAGSNNPVTSAGIKTAIDTAISSVYRFKGSVATYADLPSTGLTVGDVYNVLDTDRNYAWTGSAWDALGGTVDLSNYVPTSRTIAGNALTGDISAQTLTDSLVYMNATTDLDDIFAD